MVVFFGNEICFGCSLANDKLVPMRPIDPLSTSISLLNHARNGDSQAWSHIVSMYGPLVVRWCKQYGIQAADTDDVIQNVFIAVSKHLDRFGQSIGEHKFRGWLWKIAKSKIMDHLRQKKCLPIATGDQQLAQCFQELSSDEGRSTIDGRQDLQLLVNRTLGMIRQDFSDKTWNAFWRTTALGEPPSEVGIDLGMSSAAVCMSRARVLRRLRESLQD